MSFGTVQKFINLFAKDHWLYHLNVKFLLGLLYAVKYMRVDLLDLIYLLGPAWQQISFGS